MLEELVDIAGSATKKPPEPRGGIPKRWLPAPIRLTIELVMIPFVHLDVLAHRLAKWIIPTPFKRVGKCKKRGNCCHYIRMRRIPGLLGVLQRFWAIQVNGFFMRDKKPVKTEDVEFYILGCRHLKDDGSCGNYRLRPKICRMWPEIEQFERPAFLKGCGFDAVPRKSKSPLNILK
ncbi:MAG: YkgJ family cysteine cluster protein [Simkaniaceae bacterium]|nr:YkgJ family cysteine cluster protein [Simkaniaceae bacterium]